MRGGDYMAILTSSGTGWGVSTGDFGCTTLADCSTQVIQYPIYEWKPEEDKPK